MPKARIFLFVALLPLSVQGSEPAPAQLEFFETKIRPLFAEQCYRCHGPKRQRADLRLDSKEAMLKGGATGPALVPGKPDESLMIRAVRHQEEDLRMPPTKKLSARQIRDLETWIKLGAPYPKPVAARPTKKHWAFTPPVDPPLPTVRDKEWPRNGLDHFILAELEKRDLRPAPKASRRVLIRRVTFDLIGLPPTPEEIDDFLNDDSPNAYEKLIERLLASASYGERWGRHWLDVARYADSNGLDENIAHGNAWRYRDYVIESFNHDKPYDRFVIEQLAGDLLPPTSDDKLHNDRLIATGFLSMGPKVLAEVDEKKMEMDIIDEQLDTLGRAFLGLTVGCARCHDHKFDPLETEEYYALAGIFRSTKTMDSFKKIAKWHESPLRSPEYQQLKEQHDQKVAALKGQYKGEELKKKLAELNKLAPEPPTAMGPEDGTIVEAKLHRRGDHLHLGEVMPRRVPGFLAGANPPTFDMKSSGRLQLAQWLTEKEHPLTARVMANRIWRWHFGRGLVSTTDNFGRLGAEPTHPALLDWLAHRFIEEGWSIKQTHRRILLSATYQQASRNPSSGDEQNQWYSRFPLRRLEAEAIRDSLLFVSGLLDPERGGSMLHVKNREFLFNHTSEDLTQYTSLRRTIYLPVIRNHLYDMLHLFDCTDATMLSGNRATTTVAPQALLMMNSELMLKVSEALARSLLRDHPDDEARLRELYRKVFGRLPRPAEVERALRFLAGSGDERAEAWQQYCQVMLSANEMLYMQ